jgi:acyl homoserine lactone synthase
MIRIIQGFTLADALAQTMFADRKKLFVDLLGWHVPVVGGRFEIDRYDDRNATYLVAVDEDGGHSGSLRLLPTTGPHILADLFDALCDNGAPRGEQTFEITRLCLPARLGTAGRLRIRNRLISAMVDHALERGMTALTGVVSRNFRAQVLAMGWRCAALGPPMPHKGAMLGAFRIDIDLETPARLAATGIYTPGTIAPPAIRRAA